MDQELKPARYKPSYRWLWISLGLIFLAAVFYRLGSAAGSRDGLGIGNKVGLVTVTGGIFSSENIVQKLDDYLEREDVKAILLRVDSPGGGIAPSQEIHEKVVSVSLQKPVVASFGNVAASGGYYISLGANKIVANQGSITGSIGVIVAYPVMAELLDKIGISVETVKSGKYKDIGSSTRPATEADREQIQTLINDLHQQFIHAVAEHRSLPVAEVSNLADGGVYTGTQSLDLKLIDTLGTFEDALALAGKLGGIEGKPKILKERKKFPSFWDNVFKQTDMTGESWFSARPMYRWRME